MKGISFSRGLIIGLSAGCLTLSSWLGAIDIDDVMSTQDQRVTGVWRLSKAERRALEKWMDLFIGRSAADSRSIEQGLSLEEWLHRTVPKDINWSEFQTVDSPDVRAPALPSSSASDRAVPIQPTGAPRASEDPPPSEDILPEIGAEDGSQPSEAIAGPREEPTLQTPHISREGKLERLMRAMR